MFSNLTYLHRFIRGKENTTLLLLHGTGGDEDDMIAVGHAISAESSMLSPRGKVNENGMPRFFRRISEGVFDLEDLKFRSKELAEFVRNASGVYNFDSNAVIAVGYSNGANIAASILLLGLFRFAGSILFRPMVPLIPPNLPNLQNSPILVASGTMDQLVPRSETERLVALFRKAGAKVTLTWQEGGHALGSEEVKKANEWFQKGILS